MFERRRGRCSPAGRNRNPKFVAKTGRLCAAIDARFTSVLGDFPYPNFDATKPDPKTLPLVGKHFAKALPIRRVIPRQLRGLGEPTTGKQAWDAIRALLLRDNAVAIKQVSAALASDSKAFVVTVKQTGRLHNTIVAKAVAAGFPKTSACGQILLDTPQPLTGEGIATPGESRAPSCRFLGELRRCSIPGRRSSDP